MAKGPGQILAVRASMRRADRPRVPALCRDSHPASLIALDPVYGLSPPLFRELVASTLRPGGRTGNGPCALFLLRHGP
jgi:hypothetical protein